MHPAGAWPSGRAAIHRTHLASARTAPAVTLRRAGRNGFEEQRGPPPHTWSARSSASPESSRAIRVVRAEASPGRAPAYPADPDSAVSLCPCVQPACRVPVSHLSLCPGVSPSCRRRRPWAGPACPGPCPRPRRGHTHCAAAPTSSRRVRQAANEPVPGCRHTGTLFAMSLQVEEIGRGPRGEEEDQPVTSKTVNARFSISCYTSHCDIRPSQPIPWHLAESSNSITASTSVATLSGRDTLPTADRA
jgi:hypothetical protein